MAHATAVFSTFESSQARKLAPVRYWSWATPSICAVAEVYETNIARVRVGQLAEISSRALPKPIKGRVVRIGNMVFKTIYSTSIRQRAPMLGWSECGSILIVKGGVWHRS